VHAAPHHRDSTAWPAHPRWVVGDADDRQAAALALAGGAVVGAAFGNFYGLVTRADASTVRATNVLKGRPPQQVGSVTAPPGAVTDAWDLDRLAPELGRTTALAVVDALLALGPFGFRGPARADVPPHLVAADRGVPTAQVIAPGHRCPSNDFLVRALRATGDRFLYVTSANRSRHATGAEDSPAHWRAVGLAAEFGGSPDFVLLEHDDEEAARRRHPHHLPMSTSVLALHRTTTVPGDARPHLVLERHGSLSSEVVRDVLSGLGLGLVVGPGATARLQPRDYASAPTDRLRGPDRVAIAG
jgi:tRNA A37 threonylcarbamoyladenosine synthetase subunit TsaC/SUA5/YrdC